MAGCYWSYWACCLIKTLACLFSSHWACWYYIILKSFGTLLYKTIFRWLLLNPLGRLLNWATGLVGIKATGQFCYIKTTVFFFLLKLLGRLFKLSHWTVLNHWDVFLYWNHWAYGFEATGFIGIPDIGLVDKKKSTGFVSIKATGLVGINATVQFCYIKATWLFVIEPIWLVVFEATRLVVFWSHWACWYCTTGKFLWYWSHWACGFEATGLVDIKSTGPVNI